MYYISFSYKLNLAVMQVGWSGNWWSARAHKHMGSCLGNIWKLGMFNVWPQTFVVLYSLIMSGIIIPFKLNLHIKAKPREIVSAWGDLWQYALL